MRAAAARPRVVAGHWPAMRAAGCSRERSLPSRARSRLRLHVGLRGLAGARLRVGNETREWPARDYLIFDDTYEHEVLPRPRSRLPTREFPLQIIHAGSRDAVHKTACRPPVLFHGLRAVVWTAIGSGA
jgi:hypothetical protein